jgi:hypothetical protein
MSTLQELLEHYGWWVALNHGGLLIAPSKLVEFFSEQPPPLPRFLAERLRRDLVRLRDGEESHLSAFLDTVLEGVLDLPREQWVKGNDVDASWSRQAATGETLRPRRLWCGDNGAVLPVFVADGALAGTREGDSLRLGVGRGRRAVSRVIEWLRLAEQKVALVATARQLRLIYAGTDHDAYCEWDTALWFQEGLPGPQVLALRALLSAEVLTPEVKGTPPRLIEAIHASRKGQAEISTVLGERLRQAVERLIQESAQGLNALEEAERTGPEGRAPVSRRDIYIAATRLVMRCVVILFAEARGLLPRVNAVYESSYGLQGLREHLDKMAGGRSAERLRHGYSAWPRLLSLFSLVYHGSQHEAVTIPRYGGGLFAPGDTNSNDPVLRALAAFESPENTPNDAAVHWILERLCRGPVRVRQGRSSKWIEAPVNFSDLSSEYIGILYEGLLDFELRRAPPKDAYVFLALGDEPALPLSRLDGMRNGDLAKLLEKLATARKEEDEEEADEAEEEATEETPEEAPEAMAGAEEQEAAKEAGTVAEHEGDEARVMHEWVQTWAERAVKAATLVKYPKDDTDARVREQYAQDVAARARRLVAKVVLPGMWFLIRWGGTRKGSGTFYTRPQLAGPIVHRALQPLAYTAVSHETDPDSGLPRVTGWTLKKPEEILAIKVCDPAMGSGSFLIAALRFLTDALLVSLYHHGRLKAQGDDTVVRLADGLPSDHPSNETLPVPMEQPDFEDHLRARLKRHVVERCLYGVDLDPLAVELGRTALWVETMDYQLPFGFLDHKLKCGNALVGCWFDRFQDYPVMAWEREGGDKTHERFVHHFREVPSRRGGPPRKAGDKWTAAIKQWYANVIKPELKSWLADLDSRQARMEVLVEGKTADALHEEALRVFEELHALPVHEAEERGILYREKVLGSEPLRKLKAAFDTWCALWFWPTDELEVAPTPRTFLEPQEKAREWVEHLAKQHRFFHWELEFPDVFTGPEAGFHALVGNPPWETQKPNSMEFFSNEDPLYRTYGKQEALQRQHVLFQEKAQVEWEWLAYNARFKALNNWTRNVAHPFGGEDGQGLGLGPGDVGRRLMHLWQSQRRGRRAYADPEHPFQHQGSADINSYKMFLEVAHTVVAQGGSVGLLVPSGLYSDKGSRELRALLLEQCNWTHLYAFQNERFVFDHVHHSFKMAVVHVRKGARTSAILTRFRLGPGDSPESHEVEKDLLDSSHYLSLPIERIRKFSPITGALLEVRTRRDLEILQKLYEENTLLGQRETDDRWRVEFGTEFHMANDSALFPPRLKWEAKGYVPNIYGHWLKGEWTERAEAGVAVDGGLVASLEGSRIISVDGVQDLALPLYQGIMIRAFDAAAKGWVAGTGLRATWKEFDFSGKKILPQYLMSGENFRAAGKAIPDWKVAYRRIARTTDARTWIGCALSGVPTGDSVFCLLSGDGDVKGAMALSAVLNSYVYDWVLRNRLVGANLSWFVLEETVAIREASQFDWMAVVSARLTAVMLRFAPLWNELERSGILPRRTPWKQLWAVTPHERLRLRCIIDAVVAELYGLVVDDFAWILRACDHPIAKVCNKPFSRTLDPKGFWRVDKEKDPELRHTVLSLVAFHELKRIGLEAFIALNEGDGWMLPETLRLADYGLEHSEHARERRPVASRLGERFLPWQLEQGVGESWEECRRHAELISRIIPPPPPPKLSSAPPSPREPRAGETDLFGNPLQKDLFGNVVELPRRRGRRR